MIKTTNLMLILGAVGVAAWMLWPKKARAAAIPTVAPRLPVVPVPTMVQPVVAPAPIAAPKPIQPGMTYTDEKLAVHVPTTQIVDWGRQFLTKLFKPAKEGTSKTTTSLPAASAPVTQPQSSLTDMLRLTPYI